MFKPKFLTTYILENTAIEDKKTLLMDIKQGNKLDKQEKIMARAIYKL